MGINRVCSNRPIRQDYLDDLVWSQVIELLENPEVIRTEIDRRVQQAQQSNPMQVRKESLVKEQIRIKSGMDRLLDAYQEGLLPLTDLRQRIPDLKKREAALRSELESLEMNFIDQQQRLQLTENLEELMKRLHQSVNSLNLTDRQKVLRLVVKEILVSPMGITIKHSIPITKKANNDPNYQLHTDRQDRFFQAQHFGKLFPSYICFDAQYLIHHRVFRQTPQMDFITCTFKRFTIDGGNLSTRAVLKRYQRRGYE